MRLTFDQIDWIWDRTNNEVNLITIESKNEDDIGNIKVMVSNIDNNMGTIIAYLSMYGNEIEEEDYVK